LEYERIIAAAIKQNTGLYAVAPPGRHSDVFLYMVHLDIDWNVTHVQGFITNTGRFVDRTEAKQIAEDTNQIILRFDTSTPDQLYSENVW